MLANGVSGRNTRKISKHFKNLCFIVIPNTIRGEDITISIAPDERNNYISDEFANELAIPESSISEWLDFWNDKEYVISNLQWDIGDYTGISQFIVKSLWSSDDDLVLGLPWLKTLLGLIFEMLKKNF